MVRNPLCSAFLCSWPFLCESCSTSQILLAHSGPHLPNTMSPNPYSGFSSSFDPSNHSPPPSTPNPLAAAPYPFPQPPPYIPCSLPPSQGQASTITVAPNTPPQPVPEISPETSAPPSTLRVPSMYLVPNNFKTGNFLAGPHSFPCPTPPFMGSSWSRRHCSGSCPVLLHWSISGWNVSWLFLLRPW